MSNPAIRTIRMPSRARDTGKVLLVLLPLPTSSLYCMRRPTANVFAAGLLGLWTLLASSGCSPTFNWRDVRPEGTGLVLLLPCKPDQAKKTVPLGGQPAELSMSGCEVEGLTFAVAVADLYDAAKLGPALAQWQAATLANMNAPPLQAGSQLVPFKLPGAALIPAPALVRSIGQRPDGTAVQGRAAYFAQGTQVFQVVIYGKNISTEVADTFFGSLKLQ